MTKAITTDITTRDLVERSISKRTRDAYGLALDALYTWLDSMNGHLDDEMLARYLTYLYSEGKSAATASQVVAAVRFSAKINDQQCATGPLTDRVLTGFRREARQRGRGQAFGIQWSLADKIARNTASDGLTGLRDAAIIAVMSDALLRISEVSALERRHIEFKDDAGLLHIERSKTDQDGKGEVLYLGEPTMQRLKAWLQAGNIKKGPLFRQIYQKHVQNKGLCSHTIARIVKARAREAGIQGVSGHSFRVGAAQSLASAGASLVEMQTAGRWKSPSMPARYAKGEFAARGAVARLRYDRD